jgi:deoxyribose-phosphate aldolase
MESPEAIAGAIDHSLLKITEHTRALALRVAVADMRNYGFRALVVPPNLVATVKTHNPDIRVAAVVSYPMGCDTTACKLFAMEEAREFGADEVDVVLDLFAVKAANWAKVEDEAGRLCERARGLGLLIKLIFETPILSDEEIAALCRAVRGTGADFWKTSTGYGRDATTENAVRLLAGNAPEGVRVKASGGISNLETARAMLAAGASVIGTSSGPRIVEEARAAVASK